MQTRLPPSDAWPEFLFDLPSLRYPSSVNAGVELLDQSVARGWGARACVITDSEEWTYSQLLRRANQLAHLLRFEYGLEPGERVLLRGWNTPWTVAWWFAILKAGGVVVTTTPLLRSKELHDLFGITDPRIAVCDQAERDQLDLVEPPTLIEWQEPDGGDLLARLERVPDSFENSSTRSDDVCLIASTSGTTGKPKAPCHFHRSVLAIADTFSAHILRPDAHDRFIGSPSLAFTYGLGALVVFPMRVGAATILLPRAGADELARAIERHRATICFTAPKAYMEVAKLSAEYDLSSLRTAVSGGEHLPGSVSASFRFATGISITNGIGSTEMLHNFISSPGSELPSGATGRVVRGFDAKVVDASGAEVPTGEVGSLAVRGPTGCLYLDDPRQRDYVRRGWNFTGDSFIRDADNMFWYQGRSDDMVIAAGYNVSPVEVEEALLAHGSVVDSGVCATRLPDGSTAVKAYVVVGDAEPSEQFALELKQFVRSRLAVFKVPREITFVPSLPRTPNGKLRRGALATIAPSQ